MRLIHPILLSPHSLLLCTQRRINFLRRHRHVEQPHAAIILHGVDVGRRRRHVGMLANAFGFVRPWAVLAFDQHGFEFWNVENVGNLVFAEIRRHHLALIVEQFFHQTGADRHDRLSLYLSLMAQWIDDRADVVRGYEFV